jgi:hypothetical protein
MFKNELNTTIVEKGSNNKGTNKTQPKTRGNDDDHDDDPKTRFNPHTQHKMLVQSLTAKKPIIGSKSTLGDDGNK